MIKNEAISLDKVNAAIKEQLSKGVDAENKVSIVVDNLNAKDGYKNYSALTQLNDAINLRVKEGMSSTRLMSARRASSSTALRYTSPERPTLMTTSSPARCCRPRPSRRTR